jgi:hypothetical protein
VHSLIAAPQETPELIFSKKDRPLSIGELNRLEKAIEENNSSEFPIKVAATLSSILPVFGGSAKLITLAAATGLASTWYPELKSFSLSNLHMNQLYCSYIIQR